jgi:integrase
LDLANWRRHVLDPAVRAAGPGSFTPHNFRDTAASLAVSAGANIKAVQRMLGHQSAAMTLDRYAGLFSDDLDAVAQHLDDAVGAAAAAAPPSTLIGLGDAPSRR